MLNNKWKRAEPPGFRAKSCLVKKEIKNKTVNIAPVIEDQAHKPYGDITREVTL